MVGRLIQLVVQVCVAGCACVCIVGSILCECVCVCVCRAARESIACGLRRSKNRHAIINFVAYSGWFVRPEYQIISPSFVFRIQKNPEPKWFEREKKNEKVSLIM